MSVQLTRLVRLKLGAATAKPGPAIGQALGPLGINMAEFCKQFNDVTKNYEKDTPLPVVLSAFSNRTFTFIVKTPPTSWLLKKCAGLELGTPRPGHDWVGVVHCKHIYEIAKIKQTDKHMAHIPLESIARSVVGSTKSVGLKVVNGQESPEELKAILDSIVVVKREAKAKDAKKKDASGGKK